MDGYVLGVDGGGTRTRSIVMDIGGTVHGVGASGPSNPVTGSLDRAVSSIINSAEMAQRMAGARSFRASFMGVAGTDRSNLAEQLRLRLPPSFGETRVFSDSKAALAGATGCKPGLVIIAGTGSIVYGENLEGHEFTAGGWGWRVGDEGSGYSVGVEAIKAAIKAHEGRSPETSLTGKLLENLNLRRIEELVPWVYDPAREPRDFASLLPLVQKAEAEGDEVARIVMAEAGVALGFVASAAVRRLGLKGGFPVAYCGGVFRRPGVYGMALEEVLRREEPDCVVTAPRFSAPVGSALLALKWLGVEIGEELLLNVERSIEEQYVDWNYGAG